VSERDNFVANLQSALARKYGANTPAKILADILGVHRTTANRLRSGQIDPKPYLPKLESEFDIPHELWLQNPAIFTAQSTSALEGDLPEIEMLAHPRRVDLETIRSFRRTWKNCFSFHHGQYIAYWRGPSDEEFMASLLEIYAHDTNGLQWRMINPYIMEDENNNINNIARAWLYEGVVYPVANYLYFFGEQKQANRFEILNIITTSSPIKPPDLLFGCMSGIYVKDGRRRPAVNIAIVMAFQNSRIDNWRREIGTKLGRLQSVVVQRRIREFLSRYPGVIAIDA
jgi:hypothetical protein